MLSVFISSCVPPPPATPIVIDNTRDYNATFDKVWGATVEFFAITNLSIATIEKTSGIIATNTFHVSAYGAEECVVPTIFLWSKQWARGRFNVFMMENEGVVNVRVTTAYEAAYSFDYDVVVKPCQSTGFYESLILDYIEAKVAGSAPPVTPIFTPGRS